MKANGLWEAILTVSDAILIDSRTLTNLTRRAFLRSHWQAGIPKEQSLSMLVSAVPVRTGEHDVDTVLHQVFSRLLGDKVFEGMCNPPGGDWSGVSLLTPDKSTELRWLSLPRVTPEVAKRPDHLFEIFGINEVPLVLVIESKERSDQVEVSIGPRLTKYVTNLISTIPSIRRQFQTGQWNHASKSLAVDSIQFVSAAAFIGDKSTDLGKIAKRAGTDIVFSLEFGDKGRSCIVHTYVRSLLGEKVIGFLYRAFPTQGAITLSRD
jgi:hypothetical protein